MIEKMVSGGCIGSLARHFNAQLHKHLRQSTYQLVTVNRHILYVSLCVNQKSSGNGKDLLQIHVSTSWVGRNHTPVRRYYTCAVTQIGVGSR